MTIHTTANELQHNGEPKVLDKSHEEKDSGVYANTDDCNCKKFPDE